MNYLYNAIRTPDGTLLESWNEEVVEYTDSNGKTFKISGGFQFLYRNIEGFTELSIPLSLFDSHVKTLVRSFLQYEKDAIIYSGKLEKKVGIQECIEIPLGIAELKEFLKDKEESDTSYLGFEDDYGSLYYYCTRDETEEEFSDRIEKQKFNYNKAMSKLTSTRDSIKDIVYKLKGGNNELPKQTI